MKKRNRFFSAHTDYFVYRPTQTKEELKFKSLIPLRMCKERKLETGLTLPESVAWLSSNLIWYPE